MANDIKVAMSARSTAFTRRQVSTWSLGLLAGAALARRGLANTHANANLVPNEVRAALQQPRLHGEGTMRFLGFRIYQARLWSEPDFDPLRFSAHRFALTLNYQRNFDGTDIADRSLVEMRRAGPLPSGADQRWGAAMRAAFPNVQEGSRLTGLHQPGTATPFFFNGQARTPVEDPAFGPAFFGIWLGAATSEPDLRRQLLGERGG